MNKGKRRYGGGTCHHKGRSQGVAIRQGCMKGMAKDNDKQGSYGCKTGGNQGRKMFVVGGRDLPQ